MPRKLRPAPESIQKDYEKFEAPFLELKAQGRAPSMESLAWSACMLIVENSAKKYGWQVKKRV